MVALTVNEYTLYKYRSVTRVHTAVEKTDPAMFVVAVLNQCDLR